MALIFWVLFFILPNCQHEDSTNCAWHAGEVTNHVGFDMVRIGDMTIYGPWHNADGTTDYDIDYTVSYGADYN